MEGKKYWIIEGKNFDTHWTTQTDRVSFKSDDLWNFMEAYHQHKLKLLGIANVVGQSEQLRLCSHIMTRNPKEHQENKCRLCGKPYKKV